MTARLFFGAALLVGLCGAAISASYADEPPTRISHIGIIAGTPRSDPAHIAFEDRLRQLGYVEGRNLTVDFLQGDDMDRLAAGVGELARRGVDVIVVGAEAVLKAAITATTDRSIPVVFRTRWQKAISPVSPIRAAT